MTARKAAINNFYRLGREVNLVDMATAATRATYIAVSSTVIRCQIYYSRVGHGRVGSRGLLRPFEGGQ